MTTLNTKLNPPSTLKQAWKAGRAAGKAGKYIGDNPFPTFVYGYQAWRDGFQGFPCYW